MGSDVGKDLEGVWEQEPKSEYIVYKQPIFNKSKTEHKKRNPIQTEMKTLNSSVLCFFFFFSFFLFSYIVTWNKTSFFLVVVGGLLCDVWNPFLSEFKFDECC